MFLKGAKRLSFRLLTLLQNALFRCFGFSGLEKQCRSSLPRTQVYPNVGRWLGGRYGFHSFLCPQDGEFPPWCEVHRGGLPHGVHKPCALPKCGCSAPLQKQGPSYVPRSLSPQREMTLGVDRRMERAVSL